MNCDRIKELLNDYIDDLLDGDRRAVVQDHLASCSDCASRLDELQKVVAGVRNLETVRAPVDLKAAVMELIATDHQAPAEPGPSRFITVLPLAAAAVLLVTLTLVFMNHESGLPGSDRAMPDSLVATLDEDDDFEQMEELEVIDETLKRPDLPESAGLEKQLRSLGYGGAAGKPEGEKKDEEAFSDGPAGEDLLKTREATAEAPTEQSGPGRAEPETVVGRGRADLKSRAKGLSRREEESKPSAGTRQRKAGRGFLTEQESKSGNRLPVRDTFINCLLVETDAELGDVAESLQSTLSAERSLVLYKDSKAWAARRVTTAGEMENALLFEVEAKSYRDVLPAIKASGTVAVYGCALGEQNLGQPRPDEENSTELLDRIESGYADVPALATVWKRDMDEGDPTDSSVAQDKRKKAEPIPTNIRSALDALLKTPESFFRIGFRPSNTMEGLAVKEEDEGRAVDHSADPEARRQRILVLYVRSAKPPGE